ncbi:hypothetical protein ACX27_27345 [Nostoc piscinale CENA21]|uniref:Uncharacterized protein n=1 Tax=Nostoc piscinale CENA21 TaxID=224013 RepID=A0A0M4U078_9NOSO|nr:hypothetical protein [Nostoc piscinale]ALF55726.1 hypothetical protein ACX27_27345 [Nostoc piscinale CENA21]
MSIEFPIRDNYTLMEMFDCSNFANGFEEQEWGELADADRWNPEHFGDTPRLIEESGQATIFFDPRIEPPDPDDFLTIEAYEKARQEWELK